VRAQRQVRRELEREFVALYSPIGRPSIPPEKLLRAMLLQRFIRSARSGS
jgi:transposase